MGQILIKGQKDNSWDLVHAGNPCEISSNLTDENDLPMIGRLYGYDQEERVTEMRTRRIPITTSLHNTQTQIEIRKEKESKE
ncbi:hypothetical protein Tco_0275218 [Tanacetum coccineum]